VNKALKSLRGISDRLLKVTELGLKRYLFDEMDFDVRLIIVKGCRGVGKTTLLKQYVKGLDPANVIYLSLDHFLFASHRMYEVVEAFYDAGVRYVVLDEVHKYDDWSIELKNLYDSFPDLNILATSSSALKIMKGSADLSRRADVYDLPGLSFREFLDFEYGLKIAPLALDDILTHHMDIADDLLAKSVDLRKFKRYLKGGYYPFFKETGYRYHDRVNEVVNQVLEVDLPSIFNIDYSTVRQIKKLLSIISRVAPFTPAISTLARDVGVGRDRILLLLDYLHGAGIIHLLKSHKRSDSVMTKPEKVFLENSNIMHSIGLIDPALGSIRETFVMNALSVKNTVSTPAKGDFLVDQKYTFEVGGPKKSFHQISDMPNAFLIKDGIKNGAKDVVPIWLLGFLY